MPENNNKIQNKSSIVILIAVIIVIASVLGLGLYQNYSKDNNNTPDEVSTSQISTTEEQTMQEVSTVAPTKVEPTTEKHTEKPTEPPTTAQPTTSFSNSAEEIYSAYCDVIYNDDTQMYCIYDINHDGIKEIILDLGTSMLEQHYDVYSYDKSKGGAYYTGTLNGSSVLYESYSGNLKGFWAKQGSYCFFDIILKNGRTEETMVVNDYTDGDYPDIDGRELVQSYPNDYNLLASEIIG